jgi:hypothetical protein
MAMRARIPWATLAAVLLAVVSVVVTLNLIDSPLSAAWDEIVKLRGVSTGRNHYYDPLFMIDLAQAAALVVQPPDPPSLAQLARILSALAGGVMVFATFALARLVLHALPSLAAAAATAATPLFIVHARIFKEDIFVAAFLPLALATLIRLLQEPAPHRAILLGLLIGCAAGSKYIGALILPFAILAIVLVPAPGPERRALGAGTVSAVSIGTFLLIMLPAIRRLSPLATKCRLQAGASIENHDVPCSIFAEACGQASARPFLLLASSALRRRLSPRGSGACRSH